MSRKKEPRFISSQVTEFPLRGPLDHKVEAWYVKSFDEYLKLFEDAAGYPVVGESSADTLYFYARTIPVIKQYLCDPKIVIMLRHPVKRAFSAYQHLVRDMRENLSFEDGLAREPERIRDNWELIYHYRAGSLYYESVKAFLDNFTNVKIILTEDQEARPQQTVRDVFRFLDVDPDVDVNTEIRYNMSGKPKSQWIHKFLFEGNVARNLARPIVRRFLSPEARQRIAQKIQEKNLTRLQIKPETKRELSTFFEPEVRRMEALLGRDLSAWRS
jgi:hypothetical protein